mgnify:CR=1 FL=1
MSELLPPHDLDAERAVLGSLLIDRDAIIKVAPRLSADMFFSAQHRAIYRAIRRLYDDRVPPDFLTITDRLERDGALEEAGGVAYLTELMNATPTAVHVEYYANIVRDAAIRRRALNALSKLAGAIYDESKTLSALASEANALISEAFVELSDDAYVPLSKAVEMVDDDLNRERRHDRLVRTGYPDLDKVLGGGFQPTQLVIIGARPGVGKTAMGVRIAYQHSVIEKRPAGYISLEMSVTAITERLIAIASQVNMYQYKLKSPPPDHERARVTDAQGFVSNGKLHIVRKTDGALATVIAQARELHARYGIECLIVDYLQLLSARRRDNRTQEVSEISRALKVLAMELEIPVVALAQLNRAVEQRGEDAIPRLSDLRESGAIEADADIVIFPHRQVNKPVTEEFQEASFIVAKHRDGPIGHIPMLWKPATAEYVCRTERKEAA